MRNQYSEELNEIEASYKKERGEILDRNEKEIKQLFDVHKQHEDDYITKWAEMEEEQAKDLEEERTRWATDQQKQKINLESEMQLLERCMEEMKAVYKLNEEKLDYNKQVLYEREKVNESTLNSLKRRHQRSDQHYRKCRIEFARQ